MIPKPSRIKRKKDFEIIFKRGKSFKNSFFILKFLNNNLKESRFGFVVSQKVSKKAVVRNKVRRRMSEIIKAQMAKITPGIDLVLIALPGVNKKEFPEIKESLESALVKTKIKNV